VEGALYAEGKLSSEGWKRELKWALDMGLPGADSLTDRSITTFSRGEKPHFASSPRQLTLQSTWPHSCYLLADFVELTVFEKIVTGHER
jgi:hypothetical protein